jgi:AcrR family transcriptional regulator
MNKRKPRKKRAYDTSGRREEAEHTTERIVEAASVLLHHVRPENLSYADVAERSGVAARTVYRHFPEPKDLLRAVARSTIARFAASGISKSRVEGAEQLGTFHRMLSAEPALFRIFMAAPIRSELDMKGSVQGLFGDVLGGLSDEHARAHLAVLELLMSPFAWEVLHTHYELPPERITRACLATAELVLRDLRRHPEWLEPSAPPPPSFRAASSTPFRPKADSKGRGR